MKTTKIFGYTLGDRRRVVAATSMTEAARFFKIPTARLSKYGCETGNRAEIDLCMKAGLGKVFYTPTFGTDRSYIAE